MANTGKLKRNPPAMVGRRLRSRTIPAKDTGQVNLMKQMPQINCGNTAWIPWTDAITVEDLFFVNLRDTDTYAATRAMRQEG